MLFFILLILWLFVAFCPLLVLMLHRAYFHWYVRTIPDTGRGRQLDGSRRRLRRVIATPSIYGQEFKLLARYKLARAHFFAGDYAGAEAEYRNMLAVLPGTGVHRPGLEADYRRGLADCLEALGRMDEAQGERTAAERWVKEAPASALVELAAGRLCKREGDYESAIAHFESALLSVGRDARRRAEPLAELAICHYSAGRPDESIRYAEEALECRPSYGTRLAMHRMAAISRRAQGRFEEADERAGRALEISTGESDSHGAGSAILCLARTSAARGDHRGAIDLADKAASLHASLGGEALGVRAACLVQLGDFDAARDAYREAHRAAEFAGAGVERVLHCELTLSEAWVDLTEEKAEEGLRRAESALGAANGRLRLEVVAHMAVAAANSMLGRHDEAGEWMALAEAAAPRLEGDRTMQALFCQMRAIAAYNRSDWAGAEVHFERFLQTPCDPAHAPTGWYFIGECRRNLGDAAGAGEAYRKAVDPGIETYDARRAAARLAELLNGAD